MDSLEYEIRTRLGQTNFDPINEQDHLRFDFSGLNEKENKRIMKLFNDFDFEYDMDNGGAFLEVFDLRFYKGCCELLYEDVCVDEDEWTYITTSLKDYSGYGTVEIIKDIILEYSTNYKEIIRDKKLKKLGI